MGFLDRLFGRAERTADTAWEQPTRPQPTYQPPQVSGREEDQAVARYKYLLRTAAPDQIEAVHAEAFARLTPAQRQQLLAELSQTLPAGETVRSDSPQDLARAATRGEMRQPGYLQGTLARGSFGGGLGMGGTVMGSMMGTIAGVMIGSSLANLLFSGYGESAEAAAIGDTGSGDAMLPQDQWNDGSDLTGDSADSSGYDGGVDPGADPTTDGGAFGGDWGGGGDIGGGFDGGGFGDF